MMVHFEGESTSFFNQRCLSNVAQVHPRSPFIPTSYSSFRSSDMALILLVIPRSTKNLISPSDLFKTFHDSIGSRV
ncbi:wsv005 [White spot syndrome virus]|uniref:Wsv005 n=1 Tax=White spot syndrome virus TaxID=342409 RepID=K7XAF9_9VIRU|nr:wsv005 [White spot syndrome virus]